MKKAVVLSSLFFVLFGCSAQKNIHAVGENNYSHVHSGFHSHTPHDGILEPFFDSKKMMGYIELKLHDDKGDLELWITYLQKNVPFDIYLNSNIKVMFTNMKGKEILLSARNKLSNVDEDGKNNIRNGKTNYFIFPGDSSESADFLVGKGFSSKVVVSFVVEQKSFKTASFTLVPHTH
jgi:hypothetical protein